MDKRYWCEVPTLKGGHCTRHTNYHVTNTYGWEQVFPHAERPRSVTGNWAHVYMCGNHLAMLRRVPGDRAFSITHLDGPGGLPKK